MNNIKKNILVVEDHLISKKIAIAILESLDCNVETASGGLEALDKVMKDDYHLVLVDIGLPDIDGFQLTQEIRSKGNGKSKLPIVALTAHTDATYRNRCIESGMNSCYTKPLTTEEAKTILENYVR